MLKAAGIFARIGNKMLSISVVFSAVVCMLYGAYSFWYNYTLMHNGFLSGAIEKYSPVSGEDGYSLRELKEINPDVIGWLTIPGTNIDYPLVQGETETQYVNMDVTGEFSLSGSIFLSTVNSSDFSDPYNLLYGHHMENGAMFGDLDQYRYGEYLETYPSGSLYVLKDDARENADTAVIAEEFSVEFFCVLDADAYDELVFMPSAENHAERLQYFKNNAVKYREISVSDTDRLIALATCSDSTTNGRIILVAKICNYSEPGRYL